MKMAPLSTLILPPQDPSYTELSLPNILSRAPRPPETTIQEHVGVASPRALEGRT